MDKIKTFGDFLTEAAWLSLGMWYFLDFAPLVGWLAILLSCVAVLISFRERWWRGLGLAAVFVVMLAILVKSDSAQIAAWISVIGGFLGLIVSLVAITKSGKQQYKVVKKT
jgi:hypothetical protein